MRIYTKTGDEGQTGLVGGGRVRKDDPRISVVGSLDELNAALGWCRYWSSEANVSAELEWIQSRLFDIGAEIATPCHSKYYRESITHAANARLEQGMDQATESLPALKNFILPGGGALACAFHSARCICRRAERELVAFAQVTPVRSEIKVFLNRLSDWLFVSARVANQSEGKSDIIWSGDTE